MTPEQEKTERAAFEASARLLRMNTATSKEHYTTIDGRHIGPGDYILRETMDAWRLWCARAAMEKKSVTMSAAQLREALTMLSEDDEELTIMQSESFIAEGETMPAGLYACLTEMPEEGFYGPLGGKP